MGNTAVLVLVVITALGFDFTNGFHDTGNATATGSIIGTGLGKRGADVRWNVAGRMATAWLFTLPAAAIVGAQPTASRTASVAPGA